MCIYIMYSIYTPDWICLTRWHSQHLYIYISYYQNTEYRELYLTITWVKPWHLYRWWYWIKHCWLRYICTRSISNETINLATYAKYTTEQQNNNNNNNYTHNNKKERKKEETNRKKHTHKKTAPNMVFL